jgi:hypothetical protein
MSKVQNEAKKDEIDERSVILLVDAHLNKILMETELLLKFCEVYRLTLEEAIRFILTKLNKTREAIEAMK